MAIVEPATAAETATNNCRPCKLRLDAPPADTVRRARERRAEQAEGCSRRTAETCFTQLVLKASRTMLEFGFFAGRKRSAGLRRSAR